MWTSKAIFLCLISTVWLTGCASIPLTSIPKLSRVDFMTTDLRQLRVAVVLPKTIRPGKNSIEMVTILKIEGSAPETTKLQLDQSFTQTDFVGLPTSLGSDQKTYIYLLQSNERAKLEEIRRSAQAAKTSAKNGTLDIAFSFKEFCADGVLPAGSVLTSTYVSSSETSEYVLLTRDVDMREDATLSKLLDDLSPCPSK
jgi:hypothetical protein